MRDIAVLLLHLLTICVWLVRPGGARSVVAESVLLKHQLLILNRTRQRAPRLRPIDRIVAALCAAWIQPIRLLRCAIVVKPSTTMGFHQSLVRCKYQWLFTPKRGGKPGPKGPSPELVAAIVAMKTRNPRFGSRRIAEQLAFCLRHRHRQGRRSSSPRQALATSRRWRAVLVVIPRALER